MALSGFRQCHNLPIDFPNGTVDPLRGINDRWFSVMRFISGILISLVTLTLLGTSANAAEDCNAPAFTHADATLFHRATVKGEAGTKAFFYSSDQKCPDRKCKGKAYVIPGDRLLVSSEENGWVCTHYSTGKREFYGWMQTALLNINRSDVMPELESWLGRWEVFYNQFDISQGKSTGTLHVTGSAVWPPDSEAPNTGDVEGDTQPNGREAVVSQYTCKVRLIWVDGELIASDNGKCGGMGVYFNGVYRKQTAKK